MAKDSSFVFFEILVPVSFPSPINPRIHSQQLYHQISSLTDKAEFESFIPKPIAIGRSV